MDFHVFDTDFSKSFLSVITSKCTMCSFFPLTYVSFAKEWLKSIGEKDVIITSKECRFCHTQSVSEEIEIEIMINGYFIAKMEGCTK
jgi:Zn-finger protein